MRVSLGAFIVVGMLAACSVQPDAARAPGPQQPEAAIANPGTGASLARTLAARPAAGIAALPDRGNLLAYDRVDAGLVRGAYTWHPVRLSEAHALRAVVDGELVLRAPDGRAIRLRYEHHVEHPDGNWTWVGREAGAMPGTEAIITFGEKAVFGSIPNGDKPPLRLAMAAGRTWLVETDAAAVARLHGSRRPAPDFLVPPTLAAQPARTGAAPASTSLAPETAATTTLAATTVVDLVIGYTSGFASRLGGQSEAITRLNFMVDVANQAYANSQVSGRLRLVRALQVSYADATPNDQALYDVTGVSCTEVEGGLDCEYVGPPAALQPLHDAREEFGGDLVSLVRKFSDPENDGCGIAWVNGGGLQGMSHESEATGFSVVGDSSGTRYPDNQFFCSDDSLAHELGHNMGSAHDRDTADGDDDVLQQNEYGAYPYSFGYKTGPEAGNFFTVMAYGDPGQHQYRVFSNPAITFCGGLPCGIANQADNARSLRTALPVVAGFRQSADAQAETHYSGDFNADGRSDILWRNLATGANAIWRSGNKETQQAVSPVTNLQWEIVGVGDFNGDGRSDILWRNLVTGANAIWKSGNKATQQAINPVTNLQWEIVGVGDFNDDGKSDILWRNSATGANTIWRSGNQATLQGMNSVTDLQWGVVGVGDFNADGRSDVLWRNEGTGANAIWKSANQANQQAINPVTNLQWGVAGVGDFNGDGKADVLWRNAVTGANTIWKSGNQATLQGVNTVTNLDWRIAGVGDFNADAKADVLWRNAATGANTIWKSANQATLQGVSSVTDLAWAVRP